MVVKNELLTHSIKAIKYRFIKSIEGASDAFGDFKVGTDARSPNEIINHMYDLVSKTIKMIQDGVFSKDSPDLLNFRDEVERFILGLDELQETISSNEIELNFQERLLQGPILDITSHIGQIAMLNGLNGNKVKRNNYYSADLK